MFREEVEQLSNAAVGKYERAKNRPGQYIMAAMLAGFFIFIAILLSHITTTVLLKTNDDGAARVLGAFLFSIAIILIVFVGGELFTGNNMTMAFGVYTGKVKIKDACRVWIYSYIGNFLGILLMCALLYFSGAQHDLFMHYYESILPAKLGMGAMGYLFRGVLCNFLVCLAVFSGVRMKTESGKIFVMTCVIASFVIAGLEHSIANMGIYTLSAMLLGGLPWAEVAKSMTLVTLGNMIGGALLFAFPIYFMSKDTK